MSNFLKIIVLAALFVTPTVWLLADINDAKWCASDEAINFLKTCEQGKDDQTGTKWRNGAVLLDQPERQKVESLLVANADKFSPAGRKLAAFALGSIGGDAAVPVLGKWAQEKDGMDAIRALSMLRVPSANKELAKLLVSVSDGDLKIAILDILAGKGDASVVRQAVDLSKDSKTASAAYYYLASVGSDEAIAAISAAKPNGEVLQNARNWALVSAAERAMRDGRNEPAVAVFKGLIGDGNAEQIRLAAAQGLLQAQGAAALKGTLNDLLKGNNESLRKKLARVIIAYPTPESKIGDLLVKLPQSDAVAAALAQSFGDYPEDVQLVLLNNITNLQVGEKYLALIDAGLKAKSDTVQVAAIQALGVSGNESSFAALAAAVDSKDEARSAAAVNAVAALKGNGVSALVLKSAMASDVSAKAKWLDIVSQRANHETLPFVIECAKSPQADVRSAAFAALKNVMESGDLAALVDLQSSARENADKKAWREALVKVAKSRAGDAKAVELLKPLLEKSKDSDLQPVAAAVAGVDNKEAADALKAQLASPDVDRRKDIIRALSSVRNQTSMDLLEDSAANGKDPSEKILALRGLLDTVRQMNLRDEEKVKIWARAWDLAQRQEEKDAIISAIKDKKGNKEARELLKKIGVQV
jgi:HEAT repeat protein